MRFGPLCGSWLGQWLPVWVQSPFPVDSRCGQNLLTTLAANNLSKISILPNYKLCDAVYCDVSLYYLCQSRYSSFPASRWPMKRQLLGSYCIILTFLSYSNSNWKTRLYPLAGVQAGFLLIAPSAFLPYHPSPASSGESCSFPRPRAAARPHPWHYVP